MLVKCFGIHLLLQSLEWDVKIHGGKQSIRGAGGVVGILLECSYLVQKLLVVCRALPTVLRVLGPEHW